jgi:hypothetical protein
MDRRVLCLVRTETGAGVEEVAYAVAEAAPLMKTMLEGGQGHECR